MLDRYRRQVEVAYEALLKSIEGLDERGSWMRLAPRNDDYLHSDGSILGQITHVAGCKVLYTSAAFHEMKIRLRDVTERTIKIGADWNSAKSYLSEAQQYWLESWNALGERELDEPFATNWGEEWALWKIIDSMIAHDHYHAGQIALTRAVAEPADVPPPPLDEGEVAFLKTFPAW